MFNAKNENEIRYILTNYNIGCLVLPTEHKILPNKLFVKHNPWSRYQTAKIKVWDNFENKFI